MSDFLTSVLPIAPLTASLTNPRSLVIYSDLKVGKSALASWLSLHEGALWLDLEDGSEALPGMKVNVVRKALEQKRKKVEFFVQLCKELALCNPPKFKYVVVDKIDQLEVWAEGWATADYKNSVVGRSFMESTIAALPYIGWTLWHEKFLELWNAAKSAAPHVVFMGSLKEGGSEKWGKHDSAAQALVCSTDIDLGKKQRKTTVGDSDATALMWRENGTYENWLSFMSREKGAFTGNRIARLEGRKFKLSWITHWTCCGKDYPVTQRNDLDLHVNQAHGGLPPVEMKTHIDTNWRKLFVGEATALNGEAKA